MIPAAVSNATATGSALPAVVGIIVMVLFHYLIPLSAAAVLVIFLVKYFRGRKTQDTSTEVSRSLGEVLKSHRTRCGMTQEFVAQQVGVSRQAVSKWENGLSEPSTSNLFSLADLFGVSAEELLREIRR